MTSKTYDSFEEAQTDLEDILLNTKPTELCPLLGRTCNSNCVCMRFPKIVSAGVDHIGGPPTKWTVYGWICTNAMFFAE